jgi:hypothetical protein
VSEQRCTITELYVSQCAHCIEARTQPAPAAVHRDLGPWFTAAYDGDCADCCGAIEPGDRIRADGDGGWLCEDCGTPAGVSDDDVWALFS